MATHTVTPTPRVLILGHSFIRRPRKFIEHQIGYLDLPLQITAPADITWHGIGGRTIAKTIKFDLHVVRSIRPDIVIVQLGTTDLPFHSAPLQVGSELENFLSVVARFLQGKIRVCILNYSSAPCYCL